MPTVWYKVIVEGIVTRGDSYLVVERSQTENHIPGMLVFPGGKVEDAGVCADILEDTLRREILEETGVTIRSEIRYFKSEAFVFHDGEPAVDILFLCEYASGDTTVTDPEEVAGVHWMTAAEILAHPKSPPWMRLTLEQAENARRR